MHKILLLFSFLFFIPLAEAQEQELFPSPYTVLSEAESLLISGQARERELKSSLKAVVWNIKKAELKKWKEEFNQYTQARDLILIQEAYGSELFLDTVGSFEGFRWDMGISFLYKRQNNRPTGTMVGSYVEPSFALVKHSPDVEPVISTPKSMTFVKYPLAQRQDELLVISVHAINFTTTSAFKRQIDVAVDEIKKHDGPVFFAGDFNTWNKARTIYLFKKCEMLGLKPVTFKNGHQRMKFGKYFLDHSFVRGVEVNKAEVLGESQGSDHKPLLIDFTIL